MEGKNCILAVSDEKNTTVDSICMYIFLLQYENFNIINDLFLNQWIENVWEW